jgi:DNA-binding transcriptional LysR family regulator
MRKHSLTEEHQMQTDRLRQFKTLVETGNMRRAASLLGMSNGGLSRSMRVLEDELRRKLIVPAGRGIAITDAGKEIYGKLEPLLRQVDDLVMKRTISTKASLRLGTFEVFSTHFLMLLIKKYFAEHELNLREFVPGKLEIAIAENAVDFGITYAPIPYAGIDFVDIGVIEMGVFGIANSFSSRSIKSMPFVAPSIPLEGSPTGLKGLDGWPDHDHQRTIRFRVELMESALTLCRAGLCVGFFPKFVIDLHNECAREKFHLKPIALPEKFSAQERIVYLVKKSSREEDSFMRAIAKAIRGVCA